MSVRQGFDLLTGQASLTIGGFNTHLFAKEPGRFNSLFELGIAASPAASSVMRAPRLHAFPFVTKAAIGPMKCDFRITVIRIEIVSHNLDRTLNRHPRHQGYPSESENETKFIRSWPGSKKKVTNDGFPGTDEGFYGLNRSGNDRQAAHFPIHSLKLVTRSILTNTSWRGCGASSTLSLLPEYAYTDLMADALTR